MNMTDLIQIMIEIQQKKPEINSLKKLTKFAFENLNPRDLLTTWYTGIYGVYGYEIIDFLEMCGIDQKSSEKLLCHMQNQAFLKCVYESNSTRGQIYNLNFKD